MNFGTFYIKTHVLEIYAGIIKRFLRLSTYLLTYLVRFQKPKLVDRSIAYAGIGATAIGTSGNRAGPAPVISEKSDKNSDKSLVTSDTTATGDNSSPDYDIQELLEAWKEYIREKVRNNVFHQYHTHSAKIQIQILISI